MCSVKMSLKIAINAVKLPKFEAVDGKSWSLRTMVLKDLWQRSRLMGFCTCAESYVVFNAGPYTVLLDNSVCLNCRAIELVKNMGGWWRFALVSPDGVARSRMDSVSASVNLPLHHKVQKFSSGTGSPGMSRKRAVNGCVCVCCSKENCWE